MKIRSTDLCRRGGLLLALLTTMCGGGDPFETVNPAPHLTSIYPPSAETGWSGVELTITGRGFVRSSVFRWFDSDRPTVFVSSTELSATLSASDLTVPLSNPVSVVNPPPGGGTSNTLSYTVDPATSPVPAITSVSPSVETVSTDTLVLEIKGSDFVPRSVVEFQGAPRGTRRINANRLEATLLAGDIAAAGVFEITVSNPPPGGGTSNALTLTIGNPHPVVTGLPSRGATAAGGGFTLFVHGVGFGTYSGVQWNGADRPTTYISEYRLSAAIPGSDVAVAGVGSVTVVNPTPGGGVSNASTITVRNVAAPSITSALALDLPARAIIYDSSSGYLIASMPSTAAAAIANTLLTVDPMTGEIRDTIAIGDDPGALARSHDGQLVWVALEGTGTVRSVSLPGLTPGTPFPLTGGLVEEMEVMPGSPRTLAISQKNPSSPRYAGVHIYDDGMPRPLWPAGSTISNTIVFGDSARWVFGQDNETTSSEFLTMEVSQSGIAVTRATGGLITLGVPRIRFASGRVYASTAQVLDAERHVRVGTFAAGGDAVYPDADLGRAFMLDRTTITAYDLNTFQSIGAVTVARTHFEHQGVGRIRLVRWGADGLAFRDGVRIHIIRTTLAAP